MSDKSNKKPQRGFNSEGAPLRVDSKSGAVSPLLADLHPFQYDEFGRQKWEYKIVNFSLGMCQDEDARKLKQLGNDAWDLFHQLDLPGPANMTICAFKRAKAIEIS